MNALIVDTGCANVRSVETALARIGMNCTPARTASEIEAAEFVVLPGVGSFGAAASRLDAQGLADPLRRRMERGDATLAICVGLQLLARGSDESPGVPGLGVLDAQVGAFTSEARVPHMGWNLVRSDWLPQGYAYFANSYRVDTAFSGSARASGWELATTEHDGGFLAALRRGRILACQFHPELSGTWGLDLLRGWANSSAKEAGRC